MASPKRPQKPPEPPPNRLALYLGLFFVVAAVAVLGLRMMHAPAPVSQSISEAPTPRGQARPIVGSTARPQAAKPDAHPESDGGPNQVLDM